MYALTVSAVNTIMSCCQGVNERPLEKDLARSLPRASSGSRYRPELRRKNRSRRPIVKSALFNPVISLRSEILFKWDVDLRKRAFSALSTQKRMTGKLETTASAGWWWSISSKTVCHYFIQNLEKRRWSIWPYILHTRMNIWRNSVPGSNSLP